MYRYFFLVFFILICHPAKAFSGESSIPFLQSNPLWKYKGASKHLSEVMRCLHGKQYPNDIEQCGVASFGNEIELQQVETCLGSQLPKAVRPLSSSKDGSQAQKVALFIDCDDKTVLVMFRKEKVEFFVEQIGFLLD